MYMMVFLRCWARTMFALLGCCLAPGAFAQDLPDLVINAASVEPIFLP